MLLFHKLSGLLSSDSLACLWETTFSLILGQCDYKPQRIPLSLFLGAGEGSVSSGIKFIKDWRVPSSLWSREGFHSQRWGQSRGQVRPIFCALKPDPQWVRSLWGGGSSLQLERTVGSLAAIYPRHYSALPIQSGCFAISFTISVPSDVCRSLFHEALSYK